MPAWPPTREAGLDVVVQDVQFVTGASAARESTARGRMTVAPGAT